MATLAVGRMSNRPTHVLLIEDSPGDADFVCMRLREGNPDLEVSFADRLSTGLAALAFKPPAVVLLDLNLPDSHGAQTFRNVLNQAPGVPVVVLSGVDDEELAVQAVHEGVQDYLVKGAFDSKQLTRALLFAIERQGLLPALDMSGTQPAARVSVAQRTQLARDEDRQLLAISETWPRACCCRQITGNRE
jgi:DNA-binding response OmpR family regulator